MYLFQSYYALNYLSLYFIDSTQIFIYFMCIIYVAFSSSPETVSMRLKMPYRLSEILISCKFFFYNMLLL